MLLRFTAVVLALMIFTLAAFRIAAALRETQSAEVLSPPNGHFVETSFGPLHYSQWGNANGRPVVMTHGMAAWGGLWTEVAEAVAAKGFRVIAVDEAPFGFSDSTHEDFSTKAQGARLIEMVAKLGLHKPILVGHSFGGGVAIESALQSPQTFEALILACPVTDLGKTDAAQKKTVPFYLRSTPISEFLVSATITNPMMTRTLLGHFMAKKKMLTDKQIETLQRAMPRAGNTHAMAVWLRQFIAGDPTSASAQPGSSDAFKLHTDLIWGDQDAVVDLEEAKRVQTMLHAKRLDIILQAGHMPQLEAPEEFIRLLLSDLSQLGTAGP